MKIDWQFIALLLTIATGVVSTSSTLWKVWRLILEKSKAQDIRNQALYENQKIQSAEIDEIVDFLSREPEIRGRFYKRKSLSRLKDNAFQDYEDEHTGFS